MATLRGASALSKIIQSISARRTLCTTRALAAGWNKDWKPGPFPVTAEERAAAAKKYGLRVEDYDVYKDDGMGYGDYPKLPYASCYSRDPYEDWDMPELKRNFGQPLHTIEEAIGEAWWDPNANPRYSYTIMSLVFLGVMTGFFVIYYITLPYPFFLSAMQKQYPFNDLYLERGGDPEKEPTIKHYKFPSHCK